MVGEDILSGSQLTFYSCCLVRVVRIQIGVVTHLHFPFGSVWFHVVKFQETKMYRQKSCGRFHSIHWSEITSVNPLSISRLLNILNFLSFVCIFPSYRAYGRLPPNQEGYLLFRVNPTLMFVSQQATSLLFKKSSSAHNAQCSSSSLVNQTHNSLHK